MKPGWGDWAGPGQDAVAIGQKTARKRERLLQQAEAESEALRKNRADSGQKLFNVMISERRVKSASKYKIDSIPHPFTSREEYERSIQMPVGGTAFTPTYMHYFRLITDC